MKAVLDEFFEDLTEDETIWLQKQYEDEVGWRKKIMSEILTNGLLIEPQDVNKFV